MNQKIVFATYKKPILTLIGVGILGFSPGRNYCWHARNSYEFTSEQVMVARLQIETIFYHARTSYMNSLRNK